MYEKSPRPFPTAVLLLGLLMLLFGIFVLVLFSRPTASSRTERTRTGKQDAPQPIGTYRNRAVLTEPATSASKPAAPVTRPEINGTVYDTEGRTLPGATVVATTFEQAGNLPSVAAAAKSDQGGHFTLPLAEGTYQVNGSLEGYGPSLVTVRTGDTVSLVLQQSGVVLGHVYDEQHRPVQSFNIDVISVVPGHMPAPSALWSKSFDSPDGSFRADQLPPWAVIVRASAKGFASAYSERLTIKPKENRSIELVLKAGCALAGTVQDKGGAPLPYVLVDAESRLTAGSASELSVQTANQMQSDPEGRFRLEHVPFGTVVVRGYDGSHAVTTVTVEVQSCDKLAPVKLVMSAGGSVAGTARTSDGKPLSGARLSLAHRTVGYVIVRSDGEGRFQFDRIPPGPARLELHHEGQRTLANITVKDGEVTQQDMTLFARGKGEIRGRITAHGRPLQGMRLLVASSHGKQGVDTYYPVTDANGQYRLTGVPEGLYVVSVTSTTAGKGVKVAAGGIATQDLDVAPQPESPRDKEPDDSEPAGPVTPPLK